MLTSAVQKPPIVVFIFIIKKYIHLAGPAAPIGADDDLRHLAAKGSHLPLIKEAIKAHTLLYQEFEDKANHPCKPLGEEPTNPLPAQLTGEGLTEITEIPVEGAPPTTRGIQCKLTKEREELRLEVLKHDAKEENSDHGARTDTSRHATHAFTRVLGESGRLARSWLTCWGDADNQCSPLEMRMMAQWYLALPDPRGQALGLQQVGRKNGPKVDIKTPLYQLPAQEAGAPIRVFHDRIVDGLVNLIHLAGIANYTVEDNQILRPQVFGRPCVVPCTRFQLNLSTC